MIWKFLIFLIILTTSQSYAFFGAGYHLNFANTSTKQTNTQNPSLRVTIPEADLALTSLLGVKIWFDHLENFDYEFSFNIFSGFYTTSIVALSSPTLVYNQKQPFSQSTSDLSLHYNFNIPPKPETRFKLYIGGGTTFRISNTLFNVTQAQENLNSSQGRIILDSLKDFVAPRINNILTELFNPSNVDLNEFGIHGITGVKIKPLKSFGLVAYANVKYYYLPFSKLEGIEQQIPWLAEIGIALAY